MRLFHDLVLDKYIEGSTGFGGPSERLNWGTVMGAVDTIGFMIVVDGVSGSNLSLGILAIEGVAGEDFFNPAIFLLLSESPTVGQTSLYRASITPSDLDAPASYRCGLVVLLNGDPEPAPIPRAHVRVWVTGRGRA